MPLRLHVEQGCSFPRRNTLREDSKPVSTDGHARYGRVKVALAAVPRLPSLQQDDPISVL